MHNKNISGKHYIDGHFIRGQGKAFTSINPATLKPIWEGQQAKPAEVQAAFEAAKHALKTWRCTSLETRISHLQSFAKHIESKQDALAALISIESGKPYWESCTEVSAVIQKVALSIEAFNKRTANKTQGQEADKQCLRYKPHGVAAVIGPFNFPAHLSNGHIVPLLLAGNTVVYKPSSYTPMVAEFMVQAWHESGLPPGVLNLVQGGAETASALLDCPIQAMCFTGSYQTGLHIHQKLAAKPWVLTALEMGGNTPLIIDKRIDNMPAAIHHIVMSAFVTAGQRCTSARRLMVPAGVAGDVLLEALIKATSKLSIGSYDSTPEPFMGPLIHPNQALSALQQVESLLALGGESLLDMTRIQPEGGFLSPGIILMDKVAAPPDEEIFAPCLQVYRYQALDEAIALANQTKYGLAAGLLGGDANTFEHVYRHIDAGLINWNKPTTGASSALPFGGIKCSGNHRPSAYFAADYAAIPVASLEADKLSLPESIVPGLSLEDEIL